MKNEKTSKRVASIAGKVLAEIPKAYKGGAVMIYPPIQKFKLGGKVVCSVEEFQAIAGSCTTQTPDRATSSTRSKLKTTKGPQPGETVRPVKARRK